MTPDPGDLEWLGLKQGATPREILTAVECRLEALRLGAGTAGSRAAQMLRMGRIRQCVLGAEQMETLEPAEEERGGLSVATDLPGVPHGVPARFPWLRWIGTLVGLLAWGVLASAVNLPRLSQLPTHLMCFWWIVAMATFLTIRVMDARGRIPGWRSPWPYLKVAAGLLLVGLTLSVVIKQLTGVSPQPGHEPGQIADTFLGILTTVMIIVAFSGLMVPLVLRTGRRFSVVLVIVFGFITTPALHMLALDCAIFCRAGGIWSLGLFGLLGFVTGRLLDLESRARRT